MASVAIEVRGVRSAKGQIVVGLYREEGFRRFGGAPALRASVPAAVGSVRIAFDDVEPAAWAAGAYHDVNGNGKLDLTMVGTPSEGRGYSRVEKPGIQAPKFAESCFEVFETDLEVVISLRYPA